MRRIFWVGSVLLSILSPSLWANVDIRIAEKAKAIVQVNSIFTEMREAPPVAIIQQESGNAILQRNVQPVLHTASGMGIVLNASGYIVTSTSSVLEGGAIQVVLSDGTQKEASLIRRAGERNLALLKINVPFPLTSFDAAVPGSIRFDAAVHGLVKTNPSNYLMPEGKIIGLAMNKSKPGAIEFFQIEFRNWQAPSGAAILSKEGKIHGMVMASGGETGGRTFVVPYANMLELFKRDMNAPSGVLVS